MTTLNYEQLDQTQKQLVLWFTLESKIPMNCTLAATGHIGELWEAKACLMHFPKGATQHDDLVSRLKRGGSGDDSILDCIARIAPDYKTLGQRSDAELDELLASVNLFSTPL